MERSMLCPIMCPPQQLIDLPEQVDLKLDVKFLHVTAPLCFKMQTIVAYRYRYGQNLTKIF